MNQLRDAENPTLPPVTYANPATAQQIKYMVSEEKRRALFDEGRFFYTKLKNPDVLWFPRNVGAVRSRDSTISEGSVS